VSRLEALISWTRLTALPRVPIGALFTLKIRSSFRNPAAYIGLCSATWAILKQLHLKPERIRAASEKANESTSETLSKLSGDLERVKIQLASVRTKLGRLVDVVTEGGKEAMASIRERMRALESERSELEATEARLKSELAAEQTQEIVAADQIRALTHFNQIVKANEDKPDRIKAIIPRFVDYVILHEETKGEGQLEVGIFGDPIALAPEVEWPVGEPGEGPGFAGASQVVGASGHISNLRGPVPGDPA